MVYLFQQYAKSLLPWMTVEEAYLLASWLKGLSPDVTLAMTPARVDGQDDTFPKDVRGNAVQPAKFTIRAEKCPNRLGVEAVVAAFDANPGIGTFRLEGKMIDRPHLRAAKRVLGQG